MTMLLLPTRDTVSVVFHSRTAQVLVLLGIVLSIALISTPVDAMSQRRMAQECREIVLTSHKGEGNRYDENTIEAFRSVVREGAEAIETDLRLTSDGQWILMHDPSVNRTTRGSGLVADMTLSQVKSLKTNRGQRVPTLRQFLNVFDGKSVRMQLEVKTTSASSEELGSIIKLVNDRGLNSRVIYTSTSSSVLKNLKNIDSTITTGLIGSGNTRPSVAAAQEASIDAVMARHSAITKTYVDQMHGAGIKVSARSIENQKQYRSVVRKGVDRVVTDDISDYKRWCRRL